MNDKPNIYQRLAAVMREVAYVQKDARVENYKAVTHDNVVAHTRPHFLANGIVVVPSMVSSEVIDTGVKTQKGTPIIRHQAVYDVAFVNVDDPADRAVVHLDAHANDYGDKAPGKTLSYAVKGAILKVLLLETGENDEGRAIRDSGGDEAGELNEDELNTLQELRDASLNGSEALKSAWTGITKDRRKALAGNLASLKEAAAKIDGAAKEPAHA